MSLRAYSRVERARVRKGGRWAGTLRREAGRCIFAYDESYAGSPVATTLPMGATPTVSYAGAVPPFFAGLLPEGRRLTALRRAIKTSADDEFSLLVAVGHDPIGDVCVMADGGAAPMVQVAPADLSSATFDELYARVLAPEPADRVGLPGVQAKLSDGMISLPLGWGERPSILKLSPPEFPAVVENEAWFYGAAAAAGLRVPEHRLVTDAAGVRGLLLARFDRVRGAGGAWQGLAQEDACQVLGLYPADKYRPSTEEVIVALADHCDAPVVAARDLFRMVVFAYVSCNGDAHAKNFSIQQHVTGEWRPTPAYDLPSTHPYGDTTMALTVDGRDREDIGRVHLLALAAAVGLPRKAAERVIDEVARALAARLPRLAELPLGRRRVHKLGRAIRHRLARVGA